MRDAPALSILPPLVDKGATIVAHDPQGMAEAKPLLPGTIEYGEDISSTVANADVVVLLTEWNTYRGLHLGRLLEAMRGNVFVDLRNVYEPDVMEENGFSYHCVGR